MADTEIRIGRQTPTTAFVLPYEQTLGTEAIELYQETGREAHPWQITMTYDLMAVNDDGTWVHQEFDYSIPRRNGKGEILTIRELWGLHHGEKIAHTAHLANTSSAAALRLANLLKSMGYREVYRTKKDETYEKCFKFDKQHGSEMIALLNNDGSVSDARVYFRTRTGAGGLGEGYDLLIIDEAQEFTSEQMTALQYTVTDSKNPQTIMCGTPPTVVSKGDVFVSRRKSILQGKEMDSAWCEWSIEAFPEDAIFTDPEKFYDLIYDTNPSLGLSITIRAVLKEWKPDVPGNKTDFVIQRLGLWILTNQASVITADEWDSCLVDFKEYRSHLKSKIFVGIKYSKMSNTVMAICIKTDDNQYFIECIDCRPTKLGDFWLLQFLSKSTWQDTVVDGANGQELLRNEMSKAKLKKPIMPKVIEIEQAHELFERALTDGKIHHNGQNSLRIAATNCEKRAIGANGGWGYRSIKDGVDISLLDAVVLAFYAAATAKEETTKRAMSF